MSRLIDIGADPVAGLTVRVGDVLSFSASGGRVESGGSAIETLGSFLPAVVGLNGEVLTPETPPTTVLFRAAGPGRARLTLFSGSNWAAPQSRTVEIEILD
ncbi:MAG: hypothetical protein QOG72_2492 [Sphingomonadales bacterium]|nr:hypothetical protein [Sphingomonadales bacterium]